MINTSLFPYSICPIRLEIGDKKDLIVCHFQHESHLEKYIEKNKLDRRKIKVFYRDGEPTKPTRAKRKTRKDIDTGRNPC